VERRRKRYILLGIVQVMTTLEEMRQELLKRMEYGVTDKKCVCQGLNLTLEMAEFYRTYATEVKRIPSIPETKEGALKIVKKFLEKIRPEDACEWRGKEWLRKARSEAVACERERDGCLMALEWLRAAIHDDYCLDAKLTCQKWKPGLGSEFVEKQPYNNIKWAMYGLAGFGTMTDEDAVRILKQSLEKHSCIVSGG